MLNSKWEVVEIKTERVLDWHAVCMLVAKVVVLVFMTIGLIAVIANGIDKQSEFNDKVLNSHISASQRAAVVARGLR